MLREILSNRLTILRVVALGSAANHAAQRHRAALMRVCIQWVPQSAAARAPPESAAARTSTSAGFASSVTTGRFCPWELSSGAGDHRKNRQIFQGRAHFRFLGFRAPAHHYLYVHFLPALQQGQNSGRIRYMNGNSPHSHRHARLLRPIATSPGARSGPAPPEPSDQRPCCRLLPVGRDGLRTEAVEPAN